MAKSAYRVRGYLSAKKDTGVVVVCVGQDGTGDKRYLIADLNEALAALTGRMAYARLKEKVDG